MGWLFSFEGRVSRRAYAPAALAAGLLPHLIGLAVWAAKGAPPDLTAAFWFTPLRWAVSATGDSTYGPAIFLLGLGLLAASAWISAALAVRRAVDAGVSGWIAALVLAPVLQVAAFVALAVCPSVGAEPAPAAAEEPPNESEAIATIKGLLWAMVIAVLAVALAALVFKTYGYALFLMTPVLIGVTTGLAAGRRGKTRGQSLGYMSAALGLAGIALLIFALEGAFCIILASPLAWFMGWIGCEIGMAFATAGRRPPPMASLVLLPLMFAGEKLLPPTDAFDDTRSVEVAATPEETWQAVLHMRTIDEPPPLPFRLGVAYPVRGEVTGEGVGAIRRGYFSTGVAVERVTEWKAARALGFVILSEPPVLIELSPYGNIRPAHVDGYFRSVNARITLEPMVNGHTRLTLYTRHESDLQPAAYWSPLTRWVVRENKARVLKQMRRQAEAAHRG